VPRLILALAILVAGAGSAAAAMFNPTSFTLDNGLELVVVENRRAPVVSHMVWYRVGSADERPGESGLAHFLEHLMFKGTKTIKPQEFSKVIAANGGEDNAMTSYDFTAYYQSIAKDRLELVMRMEADRMQNLVLTDAEVLPEREVVREERRSRTDNRPQSLLHEQASAAFYLNHPYGRPIIGWMHEIEALTTQHALEFYKRHYMPNNAIVVVAGDVTPAEVKALAERTYGQVPKGEVAPRVRPREPDHGVAMRASMESSRVREPEWSRRYLAPSYRVGETRHAYPLQVLAEILGGGATSRFYRGMVVEKGIANSMGAGYDPGEYDLSEFSIYGSPREGTSVAALEEAADAAIKELLERGVTEEEVRRAKRSMQSRAIYARDSLRTAPNIFGRALTTGRTIADVEAWPERIEAVTLEQVNEAARSVFDITHSMTSILLPKKGD
jgi:zinc protease